MNKQRVVLITGATSGIGHAIAESFVRKDGEFLAPAVVLTARHLLLARKEDDDEIST